jgi:hypothetical protein
MMMFMKEEEEEEEEKEEEIYRMVHFKPARLHGEIRKGFCFV